MIALFLIPLLLLFSVLFMYRFSGKREFLQLDLVQFLFAFVVYPIGYIWLKNFIYILLRSEIGEALTFGNWVAIESAFTIFFLYFYAFGIIHALTKTFSLKLNRDPLYDLLQNSKYFHEFLSHVGMYVACIVLLTILGIFNIFFPFIVTHTKNALYTILTIGAIGGFLAYIGIFYSTDKGMLYSRYRRIMKLTLGLCFSLQVLFYFGFRPTFSVSHSAFWFVLSLFTSSIVSMFIFNPTKRFGKILLRFPIHGID